MNFKSLKLTFIFSLLVFIILILTISVLTFLTIISFKLGLLNPKSQYIVILHCAIASIVIGTIFSQVIGKVATRPIKNIINATKEVAKGNFDIEINENIRAVEIREMAKNFNIMIRELSKIEMFRNDFINNVSHEFKTPLSSIDGYAFLLKNKTLSEEKKNMYIDRIISNSKRLSNLVGNILQLSNLENKEITIERTLFSLDEQIRQVILLFENDWTKKNIELDIDLEHVNYFANSQLLHHVWQNIIDNAIKFSDDYGYIQIVLKSDSNYVYISIFDNGKGINEIDLERIFEKFYQADASHSTTGNGLGLTLVKRIIEIHNGDIKVSSSIGEGTTFFITLPIL